MSSEVEPGKEEEETKEQPKKTIKQKVQDNWQVGMKLLELVICALCMGLIYEPARVIGLGRNYLHHAGVMFTAFTGFMLINTLLLISRAIKDRIPFKTYVVFTLCGAGLFLVTAVLLIIDRSNLSKNYSFHPNTYRLTLLTSSVCFALSNVVVFFLDALFSFRRKQDF